MGAKLDFNIELTLLERLYIRGNSTILPKEIGNEKFNIPNIVFLLEKVNDTGGEKVTDKERKYIRKKTESKLKEEPKNNKTYGLNTFDFIRSLRRMALSEEFQYSRNLDVLIRELRGVNFEILNDEPI